MKKNGKVEELFSNLGVKGLYAMDQHGGSLRIIHRYKMMEESDAVFENIREYEESLTDLNLSPSSYALTHSKSQVIIKKTDTGLKLVAFCKPTSDMEKVTGSLDVFSKVLEPGENVSDSPVEIKPLPPEDLNAVREAVIKVMGPVGPAIVAEAHARLQEEKYAEDHSIAGLISLIRDDIGEPELIIRLDDLLKNIH